VTRAGPQDFFLYLNGSLVEVNYRKLSDGGLLIRLWGKSNLTYAKVPSLPSPVSLSFRLVY